jgi:hypothetical protein
MQQKGELSMLCSRSKIIEKDLLIHWCSVVSQEKKWWITREIVLERIGEQRLQEWDMRLFQGAVAIQAQSLEESLR